MSRRYQFIHVFQSAAPLTASNTVLVGPIAIGNYDRFSIQYQNDASATAFVDMVVEVAHGKELPASSASDVADNFTPLSTAILEVPSALGVTADAISSPVNNTYGWLRVLGRTDVSGSGGDFHIKIGGITAD